MNRRGVTIIELIILILVITIIAIALAARHSPVPSARLAAAGERLRTDLDNARRLAMTEYRMYAVKFSGNTYEIGYIDDETGEFTRRPDPHTGAGRYMLDFDEGRFRGVNIAAVDFGGASELRFGSFGKPLDGKGGGFTEDGMVVLEHGGSKLGITVTAETGAVLREK